MNNESQICFISSPHDSFFCGKVVEFKERYHKSPDEYHKALFYCLGINCDTRRNFENIYDWQTDCIKPECLKEGWQTIGTKNEIAWFQNLVRNHLQIEVLDMSKLYISKEASDNYRSYIEIKKKDINK